MNAEKNKKDGSKYNIGFWIALLRGGLAILLGLVLLLNPEKIRPFLFNMMGLYWLTTGIILLRHVHPIFGDQTDSMLGKRTSLAVGGMMLLTGLLVISRALTSQILREALVIQLLGATILLTGILHLISEFRIGQFHNLKRTTGHKFLAGFEISGGALLIYTPLDRGPIIYGLATAWALIGGGLMISDALYSRSRLNREQGVEREALDSDQE